MTEDEPQVELGDGEGEAYSEEDEKELKDKLRRMGYITSNTWLDVKFGEGLKKFFLEHFKILNIIEFEKAVFEIEADVSGVILKILYDVGVEAKVLEPIAYIGEIGENIEKIISNASKTSSNPTLS